MAQKPIQAAGGIVVRNGARPLIAVVQRSKDERWVLPRGKLERNENPAAGARREAVEETGHRVEVHEFLGAITYRVRGRPKVVQFWRMHAAARPSRDVMKDIAAVEWLPLSAAVRRLSYPLEKLFLHHVGRRVLKRRRRKAARRKTARKTAKARHRRRPARKNRGAAEDAKAATAIRQSTRGRSHAVTAAHHPRPSMLQRMLGRSRTERMAHTLGVAAILPKVLPKFNARGRLKAISKRSIHRAFTRKAEPHAARQTLSLRTRYRRKCMDRSFNGDDQAK